MEATSCFSRSSSPESLQCPALQVCRNNAHCGVHDHRRKHVLSASAWFCHVVLDIFLDVYLLRLVLWSCGKLGEPLSIFLMHVFFCLNFYLLSVTNDIIAFSKIWESQESLHEVSLNRSLERASFVKFLYIMWSGLHSRRGWTTRSDSWQHSLATSHQIRHKNFLWEAMWQSEWSWALEWETTICKICNKMIKLSGTVFSLYAHRVIA